MFRGPWTRGCERLSLPCAVARMPRSRRGSALLALLPLPLAVALGEAGEAAASGQQRPFAVLRRQNLGKERLGGRAGPGVAGAPLAPSLPCSSAASATRGGLGSFPARAAPFAGACPALPADPAPFSPGSSAGQRLRPPGARRRPAGRLRLSAASPQVAGSATAACSGRPDPGSRSTCPAALPPPWAGRDRLAPPPPADLAG